MAVSCLTTLVAIWQGMISQRAANAAKDAAETAAKTLGEIKSSNAASGQISSATLAEMKGQTLAQQHSANAVVEARKSAEESARLQLEASARQNDSNLNATIDSFHREERAWVGIKSAVPAEFTADQKSRSVSLTVAFTLENYGRSAAEHVKYYSVLNNDPSLISLPSLCDDVASKDRMGDVLLPTQDLTVNYVMNLTGKQIAEGWAHQNRVFANDLFLNIYGCIEYTDRQGETDPHRTPFAYTVFRKGGFITPDASVPATELVVVPLGIDSNQTH